MYGSNGGTNGESQPLQPSDHPSDAPDDKGKKWMPSKTNLAMGVLVVAVLVLYFGFPHKDKGLPDDHGQAVFDEPPVPPEPAFEGTMYRPFCIHRMGSGDDSSGEPKTTVRLLQTSMKNPSQQWSALPCYHESQKEAGIFGMKKDGTMSGPITDTYGAPDAILQVNFSQHAFPQRKTPILGFGGAFTEAAALNFHSLDEAGQEAVLELLFGKSGLGYSKGRVHMNSCDFSVKSYSFDDVDGDFDLEFFDTEVTHDVESGMVDFALRATSKLRAAWASNDGMDGELRLYASPWSPPSWMKSPNWKERQKGKTHATTMLGSEQPSCLRDGTRPESEYAQAWALYFSKFLTAYETLGLPFFGVTPQNEPEFPAPWEACSQTPVTESDFIGFHLGPILEKNHPKVKILGFDHNKDHIVTWVDGLIGPTSASTPYTSGTAYHWYAGGNNRILDGALGAPNMHRLQAYMDKLNADPEHFLINIESCHCPYTGYGGGDIETYWARAERYAHTILSDLAAGSNGWLEWNLILDSQGGPNHLGNLCDSSLLAVPHRAKNAPKGMLPLMEWEHNNATYIYGPNVGDGRTLPELNALGFPAKYLEVGVAVQPMYYYMGHISRYVRPGSRAVMGLVDQGQADDGTLTFRPKGQTVAGGGMNDLAQPDVELTLWPCEGSTRQSFKWDPETTEMKVSGHDWLGNPTTSCVSNFPHADLKGLILVQCGELHDAATMEMVQYDNYTNFRMTNGRRAGDCLAVMELENEGGAYGPRGGPQVAFADCSREETKFNYDETTSEIISSYYADGDVCMTTGWPFLQMGAFETPNGEAEKTMVILNEARDAANYAVKDGKGKVIITGSIPPRSIQTLLIA